MPSKAKFLDSRQAQNLVSRRQLAHSQPRAKPRGGQHRAKGHRPKVCEAGGGNTCGSCF